ncbi:cilia- and flagella-associated protein 206 [Orussus abietinus]|uniref:cilia- and flagella-associated protein 206 n=1 Tax=Orussus abietinus TaxID=222816 RepID=UPI0006265457|nr:cilia- and flagella-associated protein 206 [Orussus abietinus]
MDLLKKNMVRKIGNFCEEREVNVPSDLISFLLNLCNLSPVYHVHPEDDVDSAKIVEVVTEKLLDQQRPSLVTLRIQLYFAKHYNSRDEVIKRHRLSLHKKTGPLILEICETERLSTDRDVERLYQKMLVVITLLSGLGNPTVPAVLREVALSLQSVYLPSELTRYVNLPKREKEEQLMELMCIVSGIRLFNRDCQRGGEGIDDLPSILQQAVSRTRNSILELLEKLMKKVYKFTAAVENTMSIPPDDDDDEVCRPKFPSRVCQEDVDWAIEMLAASRQQEIYIRKLLTDVEFCENEVEGLMERLQGRLFKLHDTVRHRTAIPTTQVYPQFIDLADIWMSLQDEVIVLSHINNFLWQLQSLTVKHVNVYDEARLEDLLKGGEVLSDAERLELLIGKSITECGECSIFYPNVTKDFDKINLEFLGFCAWSLAVGRGVLIPGNPNIGVAKCGGKYFAFSSIKAARRFGRDPARYAYEALDFVRNNPEYVHLFQLYEEISAMGQNEEIMEQGPRLKVHNDQGVQTDLHPLPSNIDKNYTFSIWEYRRRALQLATICRSATTSTQTNKSHFRSGVYVQVVPPKNEEVQTRRDNGTNTKKLLTFIYGLRGRRDDKQHILSFAEDELEHL